MKNVLLFCCAVFLASCDEQVEKPAPLPVEQPAASAPDTKEGALRKMTDEILELIQNKKYADLAAYIHPEAGARFSLEAYVDTTSNLVLHKNEVFSGIAKNTKYNWGMYDAIEEPFVLTIPGFFEKFRFGFEYLRSGCDSVAFNYNKSVIKGNTVNNMTAVYKGCDYTEYYKQGCTKDMEVIDWYALRMVFRQEAKKYYLVGLVLDRPGV